MENELGEVKVIVESNKLLYGIKSLIAVAIGVVLIIKWDNVQNAVYLKYVLYTILIVAIFYAIYAILSIARKKIAVYENGIIINKILRKYEFKNEEIEQFEWIKTTSWYAFVPVSTVMTLNIMMKQTYPKSIIKLTSVQFARLEKKMMAIDAELRMSEVN